jgi:GTP:adenosylcobinamide-phosphate guanylyltransferase
MLYINGVDQCKTPCTANLKRKGGVKLAEFRLKGYETRTVLLEKSFNPVSLLSIPLDLMIVDALTGAIQKFDQKTYNIQLEEK